MERIVTFENIVSSLLLLYKQELSCTEIANFMEDFFNSHPDMTCVDGPLLALEKIIDYDGTTIKLKDGVSLDTIVGEYDLLIKGFTVEQLLYYHAGSTMYNHVYFKVYKMTPNEDWEYIYPTPYQQKSNELYRPQRPCLKCSMKATCDYLEDSHQELDCKLLKTYKKQHPYD